MKRTMDRTGGADKADRTGTAAWTEGKRFSLSSNVIYNMRSARSWDRRLFWYQLLLVFPDVGAAFLGVLLPAQLVRALEQKWELPALVASLLLFALGIWATEMLREWMLEYMYRNSLSFHLYYEKKCFGKAMRLDYDSLEDPENRKLMGNTWNVVRNEFVIRDSVMNVPRLMSGLLGTVLYGIMTGRKSILLILFVLLNMAGNFLVLSFVRKKYTKYHEGLSGYTAKAAYISRQSMERSAGKEIRIYRMMGWFLEKFEENLKGMDSIYGRIHNWYFFRGASEALLSFLMEGAAYAYLIFLFARGEMRASDFVLYMGLIRGFGGYFGQLIQTCVSLNTLGTSVGYIRQFLSLPDTAWKREGIGAEKLAEMQGSGNPAGGKESENLAGRKGSENPAGRKESKNPAGRKETENPVGRKASGVKVELRNVSYTYPGQSAPALSGINITIQPGEKLALIGLNGAGKTTLVKLLCGFYRPTEGEILVNDIPSTEFTREEYYSLVSVLFQDSAMLPVSLDENLTGQQGEEIDRQRLGWALEMSGFLEKYESLPKKGDTLLVREANCCAVDFSGGERQKLLFARALYKKAPLLILDEPTAALDPIAENELYLKYGEAAAGRTSVYISHRLSSTRFCDRILLLSHGKILEEGTHEELMKKGGRYAELYEIQSRYYREEAERKELFQDMTIPEKRSDAMEDLFESGKGTEGVFYE